MCWLWLQALSLARGFRFSLLSGDVHVAAAGRLMSHPKKSLRQDHRWAHPTIDEALQWGSLQSAAGWPGELGHQRAATYCYLLSKMLAMVTDR